ncbi:ribosomal RNA small subunit methyltransferase I [Caedimonas varicaedens]|uniref:Ribosomal RNA small subunit methyltransferase I n=1 Tax=Caedimonas varicaedens TaxID=1629334 RepID=A0A0K8MCJ6_9PROT|nr:ribosomal RNA small subunit methyltransferase I [Caedimonas varicaedens]
MTQSNTPYPFHHDAKPTVEKRDLQAGIYIVATPLGNLKDITVRALEILHSVDLILCEDTRVSRTLLMHYSVSAPLKALHDYNESKMIPSLLVQVQEGKRLALISDAGTPLISDPGYKLVRAALTAGLFITGLPGPSAVINALVLSGLPTHRFFFAGFLPAKSASRVKDLDNLKKIPGTLIFYESPQRFKETLQDLQHGFSMREIVVVREMTKKFEEIIRGSLKEVTDHFQESQPRGEIVLLVAPPSEEENLWDDETLEKGLRTALKTLSLKDAVQEISLFSGISRKHIYEKALKIQEKT